jgi:hypothetical protein
MSAAQLAVVSVNAEQALAVSNRYSNAYLSARATVGFGRVIKGIGIGLAVLLLIVTLLTDVRIFVAALPLAAAIGALFFFLGILVATQGEILKAILDSAVNSSPFLSNGQRARIMSLPAGQDVSTSQAAS